MQGMAKEWDTSKQVGDISRKDTTKLPKPKTRMYTLDY